MLNRSFGLAMGAVLFSSTAVLAGVQSESNAVSSPANAELEARVQGVGVTPDGGLVTVSAQSSGNIVTFGVSNSASSGIYFDYSVDRIGNITYAEPTSWDGYVPANSSIDVDVEFGAAGAGSGEVILVVGCCGQGIDQGAYYVTVQ